MLTSRFKLTETDAIVAVLIQAFNVDLPSSRPCGQQDSRPNKLSNTERLRCSSPRCASRTERTERRPVNIPRVLKLPSGDLHSATNPFSCGRRSTDVGGHCLLNVTRARGVSLSGSRSMGKFERWRHRSSLSFHHPSDYISA